MLIGIRYYYRYADQREREKTPKQMQMQKVILNANNTKEIRNREIDPDDLNQTLDLTLTISVKSDSNSVINHTIWHLFLLCDTLSFYREGGRKGKGAININNYEESRASELLEYGRTYLIFCYFHLSRCRYKQCLKSSPIHTFVLFFFFF